jgi:hypothetical protein
VGAPPTDPTGKQQGDCRSYASELPMTPAPLLRHQASGAQPRRYRLLGQGCAQSLSLLGILRPPFPQLGMRRKIGLDGPVTRMGQPAIDPRLKVVLFYGPAHRPHFTLCSAAL